ncbi:MAG TPA: hypothetical protein VM146_10695 [Steroidobacteraceae bacterium]|nr:hypothetical protein [Steroidobacteraceae bacterium]
MGKLFVLTLASLWVSMMIAGCAALPEDAPVMEQLDADTGVTIARLGHPLELYRETFQRDPSGRFAFIGPFETNQMGKRELYLWIALPVTIAPGTEPDIELNGRELKLGTPGRDADYAGLRQSPYKIPTPWSAMFYYKIDADLVAKLGDATSLTVRVSETTKDGTKITVFAANIADSRLKDFATR